MKSGRRTKRHYTMHNRAYDLDWAIEYSLGCSCGMCLGGDVQSLGNIAYHQLRWFPVMFLERWAILQEKCKPASVRIFHDCVRFTEPQDRTSVCPRYWGHGRLRLHCPTCGKLLPKEILEIRGGGLLAGVVTKHEPSRFVEAFLERGILVAVTGSDAVRLIPPYIIKMRHIDDVIDAFHDILEHGVEPQ